MINEFKINSKTSFVVSALYVLSVRNLLSVEFGVLTIGAVSFIFSPNFEKNVVKNIQYLNPKFPTRNDTVNNNDGDKMFPTSTNKIGNNH